MRSSVVCMNSIRADRGASAAGYGEALPDMRLSSTAVRVATWNINSLKVRLARVEEWLADIGPDVLCLQETKLSDAAFPSMAFQSLGYESASNGGDGRWNGVAILSRIGLDDVRFSFDDAVGGADHDDEYVAGVLAESRLVSATCGGVRVTSVYVPNGRSLDDPHYAAKLVWLERLRRHLEVAGRQSPLDEVVAGDFNIAPDDRDVYDPRKFTDSTHTSQAERSLLQAIVDGGMVDTFRRLYPQDKLYSWWDYRAGDFHQGRGLRIDLVLASTALADRAVWAIVDRQARKGKQPSDHAPVVVDFAEPT